MSNRVALIRPVTTRRFDISEIGSDFELVDDSNLVPRKMGKLPWEDGSDITCLESGRQALAIVEAQLRGLDRLYSSILETNEASLTLYTQRCGWTIEGTSRNHVWRHGGSVNLLQVGVLRANLTSSRMQTNIGGC